MEPTVYVGKPDDEVNYTPVETGGLKFYVTNKAQVEEEGVTISLVGRGPWRRLLITGLAA